MQSLLRKLLIDNSKLQRMKRLMPLMLLLMLPLWLSGQQTKILTAEKHNEYGLVYTLPLTAFQIDVTAIKETSVSGPFGKYSKLFTSDANIIQEDNVAWTIESVTVTPYGIPDNEKEYLMQLKPGALTFISVSEDGMLLSINKETESDEGVDESREGLIGEPVTGKEYLEYVNEDFIAAQSSYKQAQILAEEIMDIRDAKISLTRGTAETMPTDGRQLEIMLASLEKQEKALSNAFTGASWKEKIVRSFTFLPEKEGKSVLFRLSKSDGIVDANDYSGAPIYVNVKVIEEGELPVDTKGEEKKLPKDAVIYSIPGLAKLSLSYEGAQLYEKEFQMSQFGIQFGLNPNIFTDKKEPSYAIFDPATGALKELGVVNTK